MAAALAPHKLTSVEAFRAQVLLEEALKKLQFLGNISSLTATVDRDELSAFMGEEISRILTEQRELEKQYEELASERALMKEMMHRRRYSEIQHSLQQLAQKLRESNKRLSRHLRETPNLDRNLMKTQHERSVIQEWYEETKTELTENFSFMELIKKVENEKARQELLNEVRKREKEASQAVQVLQSELQKESVEFEKESHQATQEVSILKEQLHKDKRKSAMQISFAEKQLNAEESALLRQFTQKEKELRQEIEQKEKEAEQRAFVQDQVMSTLQRMFLQWQEEKQKWMDEKTHEIQNKENEKVMILQKKSERLKQNVQALMSQMESEELELQNHEEQMRLELQRSEQRRREDEAVRIIQRHAKIYVHKLRQTRQAARSVSSKKKKKKKTLR